MSIETLVPAEPLAATGAAEAAVEAPQALPDAPLAEARERAGITDEEVAVRAYSLHIAGADGTGFDHWLRAERELLAERGIHVGH